MNLSHRRRAAIAALCLAAAFTGAALAQEKTQKPPLHGSNWMAITGKPLAATAGARMFEHGGNAVDAACAMLAATSTMWDVLSWGGETQALIYNPQTGRIVAINGLGVAPTGATADFYRRKEFKYPPEEGPLSAVTPGTPGALIVDARRVRQALARGSAGARDRARRRLCDRRRDRGSHRGREGKAEAVAVCEGGDAAARRRSAGSAESRARSSARPISRRRCASWSRRKPTALAAGKSRKEALQAAYDRFYRGDIADEFVRGAQEQGGLVTKQDLDRWRVEFEEPVHTNYRGIDVYKLDRWTQGPVMLQALNVLENFDLKAMGYNSGELHSYRVPGDEPRLRRPRLLLRRPVLPAGRADQGPAVEGIREGARRAAQCRAERCDRRPRRSVSAPGRDESRTLELLQKRKTAALPGLRCRALRGGDRSRDTASSIAARPPSSPPTRTAGSSR